jgi:hypothetical protein
MKSNKKQNTAAAFSFIRTNGVSQLTGKPLPEFGRRPPETVRKSSNFSFFIPIYLVVHAC